MRLLNFGEFVLLDLNYIKLHTIWEISYIANFKSTSFTPWGGARTCV